MNGGLVFDFLKTVGIGTLIVRIAHGPGAQPAEGLSTPGIAGIDDLRGRPSFDPYNITTIERGCPMFRHILCPTDLGFQLLAVAPGPSGQLPHAPVAVVRHGQRERIDFFDVRFAVGQEPFFRVDLHDVADVEGVEG